MKKGATLMGIHPGEQQTPGAFQASHLAPLQPKIQVEVEP